MIAGAIGRFFRSLTYGFQRELRAYEAEPFEMALQASPQPDRDALRRQFDTRERIQRWGPRVLYFSLARDKALPRIASLDENYCYASAVLRSPHGKVTAKLMTHRGLLSTLEFSRAPLPMLAEGFVVERLSLHPGGSGYAEELHVAEHGPLEHGQLEDEPGVDEPSLPRWAQILAGLVLLPITAVCVIGAISIFGIPKVQSDPVSQLLAGVISLSCLWAASLTFRLLFGLKSRHGFFGPLALRAIAVAAVGLAIGGFFTGVHTAHPVRSAALSIAYILVALRLWQMAAFRAATPPDNSLERKHDA